MLFTHFTTVRSGNPKQQLINILYENMHNHSIICNKTIAKHSKNSVLTASTGVCIPVSQQKFGVLSIHSITDKNKKSTGTIDKYEYTNRNKITVTKKTTNI